MTDKAFTVTYWTRHIRTVKSKKELKTQFGELGGRDGLMVESVEEIECSK